MDRLTSLTEAELAVPPALRVPTTDATLRGAIGYFSLNGATDLAVAIRTLVLTEQPGGGTGLSLGVGGAITADSSPQEEYEEIRTKAFGVLSALGAEFPPG